MLVKNQFIINRWVPQNKQYYESKGYTFTKMEDEFKVKAEDLKTGSHALVKVICDYCGCGYTMPYRNYNEAHKTIPKDSCKKCIGKKCAEITLSKRQSYLHQKLKEACDKKGYKLLTPKELIQNNVTVISYECSTHGIQHMRISNMLSEKGCPMCASEKLRNCFNLDSDFVASEIQKYGGFLLNPEDYVNNQTKNLRVICPECRQEFITSFRSFIQYKGQLCKNCSKTSESMGELRIRKFLEEHAISFMQEFWFDDCRDINPLPFDFYIPSKNLIIEFDGRQHFSETNHFTYSYEKVRLHDKIKNRYCEENGIDLLRIPFWNIDKINNILSSKLIFT